jgi:predicted DNA-binding transcriptional regulator AlpA
MAEATPRRIISKATTAATVNSSEATVDRWRKDPAMGFPVPLNINNRCFWYEDEVQAWIEKRPRVSEKPTFLQHRRVEATTPVAAE